MDADLLQRIRSLEHETEQQRAELRELREVIDSLAKYVCISSDEILAGWAFEYAKTRPPHVGRQLERTFDNFSCNDRCGQRCANRSGF